MSELLEALEQDRAVVAGEAERKKVGRPRKPRAGKGRGQDPGETAREDCEEVVANHRCGWCMEEDHERCMVETQPWYGRVWLCGCADEGCLSSRGRSGDTVAGDADTQAETEGITSYEQHPGDEGVLDSSG